MDSSQDPGTPQLHGLVLFLWHWVLIRTSWTLGNALPLTSALRCPTSSAAGSASISAHSCRGEGFANGV